MGGPAVYIPQPLKAHRLKKEEEAKFRYIVRWGVGGEGE
jgi:hypothetical protein